MDTETFIEPPIIKRIEQYCNGKVIYTHSRAEQVLRARRNRTSKRLRSYKCDQCYGWHLTHQPKNDRSKKPYKRKKLSYAHIEVKKKKRRYYT